MPCNNSIREYAEATRQGCRTANKREKGIILDEFRKDHGLSPQGNHSLTGPANQIAASPAWVASQVQARADSAHQAFGLEGLSPKAAMGNQRTTMLQAVGAASASAHRRP